MIGRVPRPLASLGSSLRGLGIVAVGLSFATIADAGERRFALIAGANHGIGEDVSLRYAERDAERMAQVLEDLGDVAPADVILLREATAPRFRSVFDSLAERIERANEGGDETLVYVYYSGHADASGLRMEGTEFPLDELMDRVEGLPAKMRVLVVDACQSGGIFRAKGAKPVEPFVIRPQSRLSEGVAVITSAAEGEDAHESERLHGGVFTHHFVAGLVGAADSSRNRKVTLTEAFDYASNQTLRTTSIARAVQHPVFVRKLRGSEDPVLTVLDDPNSTGVLQLQHPGEYLVFNQRQDRELVLEFEAEDATKVSLSPGSYLVRRRASDHVREATVAVSRGDTTLLADNEMSTLAYGPTVRKGLAQDKRLAVALTLGGDVIGPPLPNTGPAPRGALGLRFDFSALTSGFRIHYGRHQGSNDLLAWNNNRFGIDLYGVKYLDVGRLSVGGGIIGGLDLVSQTFETPGTAPDRLGTQGRVGGLIAFDVSLAPRWSIGFSGGLSALLYSQEDLGFRVQPLPHASIELSAYVF